MPTAVAVHYLTVASSSEAFDIVLNIVSGGELIVSVNGVGGFPLEWTPSFSGSAWTITGVLPSGLSFDSGTGRISGIPRISASSSVRVCSGAGECVRVLFDIAPGSSWGVPLPDSEVGIPYSQSIVNAGIGTAYRYIDARVGANFSITAIIGGQIVSGLLPVGVTYNSVTGVLGGAVSQEGAWVVSICRGSLCASYALSVSSSLGWRVILGELPGGLSLSAAGMLSGIPNQAGVFSFVACGAGNCRSYSLVVQGASQGYTFGEVLRELQGNASFLQRARRGAWASSRAYVGLWRGSDAVAASSSSSSSTQKVGVLFYAFSTASSTEPLRIALASDITSEDMLASDWIFTQAPTTQLSVKEATLARADLQRIEYAGGFPVYFGNLLDGESLRKVISVRRQVSFKGGVWGEIFLRPGYYGMLDLRFVSILDGEAINLNLAALRLHFFPTLFPQGFQQWRAGQASAWQYSFGLGESAEVSRSFVVSGAYGIYRLDWEGLPARGVEVVVDAVTRRIYG